MCIRVIFNSGCERYHRELRRVCESRQAHSFFFQRLNRYTAISLAPELTRLLAKIMVQILSILALSTRAKGEENLATGARNLEIAHHVDDKVTMIEEVHWDVVHDIGGDVKARACLRHSRYFTENCDVGCEPLELSSCHLEDRALQSLAYNWA